MIDLAKSTSDLMTMVSASATPYHAVAESIRQLENAGFEAWDPSSGNLPEAGKAYYTSIYDTSLAAFRMPTGKLSGFRIATAHTDSPCFRIKPQPDVFTPYYHKLNVEQYGGAIWNTWLDRPLAIAGRVCVAAEDPFHPQTILYRSADGAAVIPNLAIHMNREVNKGGSLSVQTDLEAVLGTAGENKETLLAGIAKEVGVKAEDILGVDLMLANPAAPVLIGTEKTLLTAPRLDNLTSCQSCLTGLIESESREQFCDVITLFDNEECGSRSKQGAASTILVTLLEKIAIAGGNATRDEFLTSLLNSFTVSLDVAHAIHPNHPEKCDPTNPIRLDGGVILKLNSNQKYATDAVAVSAAEAILRRAEIPYQKFANHSDIAGGGTLGSILSATIPVRTVDIGVPLLAMHSSTETMDIRSQLAMDRFVHAFFCA